MHGSIHIADAVNWGHSLNRGLVARLLALPDQQRGLYCRDICLRHHGTISGGTWRGPEGRPGGWGCISLDGSDDYVEIADNDAFTPLVNVGFTVAFWAKRRAVRGSHEGWIGKYNVGQEEWVIGDSGTSAVLYFLVFDASGGHVARSAPIGGTLNDLGWHRVVCAWNGGGDASGVFIYLDGRRVDDTTFVNGTLTSHTNTTSPVTIGKAPSWSANTFDGCMDDIVYANRAWTATDALIDYREGKASYLNVLNWHRRRHYVPEQGGAAAATRLYTKTYRPRPFCPAKEKAIQGAIN